MPKLVVISEELAGKTYDLALDTTTVGRSADNAIRIDDSTVSSHHATIQLNGRDVILRDLNSTNGTRLNGQKVTESKLAHGDIVRFGRIELRFEGEIKKTTSPLPKPSSGISAEEIASVPAKREGSFSSASPFPKERKEKRGAMQYVIMGLSVLAALLLGYMIVKLLGG
jgi:pSer/pThr/pTyr-binding forkhead associated (FHA) protein